MTQNDIIPGLFKSEFGKICSVLGNYFGFANIEAAEDLTSETFLAALETWPYKGVPDNPTAWLYAVAKNKAKNYCIRNGVFKSRVVPILLNAASTEVTEDPDLSPTGIADSQLKMLFAVCDPSIPVASQVGLALRILCGLSIDEIANAFLTNRETINKRLSRARTKLRDLNKPIPSLTVEELVARVDPVLRTIYLLFNEGYYSESADETIRGELAVEAMRLAQLLLDNEHTNLPTVKALMAIMCFHTSRFNARMSKSGEMILYHDQDEKDWNFELINRGVYWLHQSAGGENYSAYHLEAAIAYWHTKKHDSAEKWENILQLYNRLLQLQYSPVAALNRTYALYKTTNAGIALAEVHKLKLEGNRFYHALLAELYSGSNKLLAIENLEKAISLTNAIAEKELLSRKLEALKTDNFL